MAKYKKFDKQPDKQLSKKLPRCKADLYGVFYKTEQIKDTYYYHFLLPGIYQSIVGNTTAEDNHTTNILINFDTKVSEFFEKNIEESILFTDSGVVKINKPTYRDKDYRDFNAVTHFKCKSADKMTFIVGLEYIINCEIYAYNFVDCDNGLANNVMGWTIKIITTREITKI